MKGDSASSKETRAGHAMEVILLKPCVNERRLRGRQPLVGLCMHGAFGLHKRELWQAGLGRE